MEAAAIRVARGAVALDKAMPGWAEKIDTKILNLASFSDCICGQLYGNYDWAPDEVRWGENRRLSGFDTGFIPSRASVMKDNKALVKAWKDAIAERKSEPPVVTWTHRVRETAKEVVNAVVSLLL